MCRMTWDLSETQSELVSMCYQPYSIEKDGHQSFYNIPKTAWCFVKALIAARLPHLVEETEVLALLSAAELQFADLSFQTHFTGLPLALGCSLCARHLGDRDQASVYAKEELLRNLSPVKQNLAHMTLAVAGWPEE